MTEVLRPTPREIASGVVLGQLAGPAAGAVQPGGRHHRPCAPLVHHRAGGAGPAFAQFRAAAADESGVGRLSWFRDVVLPQARLSDEAYRVRHRALRIVLWLQLPLLSLFALVAPDDDGTGMAGMGHSTAGGQFVTEVMAALLPLCALASLVIRSRRGGAGVVSLGLLLSCALLVSIGGGLTDLHFAYFLVVGLISLYQDWWWLALSLVLVTVQHLVMGVLAPGELYSDPRAANSPVRFALLHAVFVLGTCAVQVAYWRFIVSAQLQTDQVRADSERRLRRSAERSEALVQDSVDVILVVDGDGRIVSASSAAERIMGYRPEALAAVDYHSLIHPQDEALIDLSADAGRGEHRAEVRTRHADGTWHWHEVTMRNMLDNPLVAGWVINHRDVTERRMFQQRLEYEASHDALTGLPNRARLLGALERGLAGGTPGRPGLAVLYLDLDGFKQVNDQYGHETGDALLVAVATSLQRCVLGGDTVGRLGGDEFAVVLNEITSPEDAIAVATRILTDVAKSVTISGRDISARVSIGIALAVPGSVDTDELMHRADTAMYHAKRDGGTFWRLYVDGMQDPGTAGRKPVMTAPHAGVGA